MSDVIQNVRIKFTTDTTGLSNANAALNGLTTAEQQAVKSFNDLNSAATKAGAAATAGAKAANTENQKTVGIINLLRENISALQTARDKSNDPSKIKTYNAALDAQNAKLQALTSSEKDVNKAATTANGTFKTVGATLLAAFSVSSIIDFGKQILSITSEFEKLRAVLANTLGSTSLADSALSKIKTLAANTNFGVLELTNAYVKLANSGFEPTVEQLTALADLTNSTGKTFDQLAEAILDANTDQFIRLKEFGIKATREGDQISFLFKGVRTEVDRNAKSITDYLVGLGKIPGVMGATAAISQTLAGKTSNLGDSYDFLLNTIGSQQSGFFKDAISGLTSFTNFLNDALKSTEQFNEVLTQNASGHYQNQINGYIKQEKDLLNGKTNALDGNNKALKAYNEEQIKTLTTSRESNIEDAAALKAQIDANNLELSTLASREKGQEISYDTYSKTAAIKAQITKENEQLNSSLILTNGQIAAQEQVIHNLSIENKSIDSQEAERARLAAEQAAKDAKAREALFKKQLDELNQLEANDVARATLEGQTQQSIVGIEQNYNNKREALYQNYNKTRTADYAALIIKTEQLDQSLTVFEQQELDRRTKQDEDYRNSTLSNIDQALKQQNTKTTAATNIQIQAARQAYIAAGNVGIKEEEQLQQNIIDIQYKAQRTQISNAITADQEKLKVAGLTSEEQNDIQADLVDKQKELDDLDFDNFQQSEKAKTAAAQAAATQRAKIAKDGFDAGVKIVNGLFQIGQNARDAEAQDLQVKQNQELANAGDNQAAQAAINAKYAKLQLDIRIKDAKAQKTQAEFDAALNGAVAITSALKIAPPYGLVLAAIIAADVAVQIAAIQTKPLPKYFHGTESLQLNGNPDGIDTIPIMAHKNERIVPSYINEQLKGIANADLPKMAEFYNKRFDYAGITKEVINGGSGGRQDAQLVSELRTIGKKLDSLKVANITFDKHGFKTYMNSKNAKTEFVNNYFRN